MASTFFHWLRSPAAREYFFSRSNENKLLFAFLTLSQALTSGDQFVDTEFFSHGAW